MLVVARSCKREEQDGGEDERRRGRAVGEKEKREEGKETAKEGEKRELQAVWETEEELHFVFLYHLHFHFQ